jgi:hypothetical protein
MAKKATTRKSPAKRASHKRQWINTGTDTRFVKRRADGTFKESDDVGRSQRADRAKKARTAVKPGYGDQGSAEKAIAVDVVFSSTPARSASALRAPASVELHRAGCDAFELARRDRSVRL